MLLCFSAVLFMEKNHPIQRPACLGSSLDQLKIWVLMRRRTDLGWRYMAMWSTWKFGNWWMVEWMEGTAGTTQNFRGTVFRCGMWPVCETKIWEFYCCCYWKSTPPSWSKYLLTTTSWYLPKLWMPVDFVSPEVTLQISPGKLALWGKLSEGECFGPTSQHIPTTCLFGVSVWTSCIFIVSPWRPGTDLNKFEKMHAKVPKIG